MKYHLNALLAVLKAGDHLLVIDSVYRPTRIFCDSLLKRYGGRIISGTAAVTNSTSVEIADPVQGSFIATKDYAKVMRRLPDLLMPGGQVLLCLNEFVYLD